MVNFAVINELSLPFTNQNSAEQGFVIFVQLLSEIKKHGFIKIRAEEDFKKIKVTEQDWFSGFFGKIQDQPLKDRIRILLTNELIEVATPLVTDEELEKHPEIFNPVYLYKDKKYFGGLACADYWSALSLSFNSNPEWDCCSVTLIKDDDIVQVRHASSLQHLGSHQDLFRYLERELKLGITQRDFWQRRQEFFSKIDFLDKIEGEVVKLDAQVFKHFISILRGIETNYKPLSKLDTTGESTTTNNKTRLKELRTFTHKGAKLYFEKHIKNLPRGYRIHYLETPTVLLIGYVGPHLPT